MEIRWLGEVCSALPYWNLQRNPYSVWSKLFEVALKPPKLPCCPKPGSRPYHQAMPVETLYTFTPFGYWPESIPKGETGVGPREVLSKAPEQAIRASGNSHRGWGTPRSLTLSPFLYPSLLSETRISTIPSGHATGRDPLRHTFDPLIEGSSWSKRLSLRGKLGAS